MIVKSQISNLKKNALNGNEIIDKLNRITEEISKSKKYLLKRSKKEYEEIILSEQSNLNLNDEFIEKMNELFFFEYFKKSDDMNEDLFFELFKDVQKKYLNEIKEKILKRKIQDIDKDYLIEIGKEKFKKIIHELFRRFKDLEEIFREEVKKSIDDVFKNNVEKYLDEFTFNNFQKSSSKQFHSAIQKKFEEKFLKHFDLKSTFQNRINKIKAINKFFEMNLWKQKIIQLFKGKEISSLEEFIDEYNNAKSTVEIQKLCAQYLNQIDELNLEDSYSQHKINRATLEKLLQYIEKYFTDDKLLKKEEFLEEAIIQTFEEGADNKFWPFSWKCEENFKKLENWSMFTNRNEERKECFEKEMTKTEVILTSAYLVDNDGRKLFSRF